MRSIVLMRHGQAVAYQSLDAERTLTAHGRKEVLSTSTQLLHRDVHPDLMICSNYRRAIESCTIAAEVFGYKSPLLHDKMFTPEADPLLAIDYLCSLSQRCVWAVCHMPIVSLLLEGLTIDRVRWAFPTAGAVHLISDGQGFRVMEQFVPRF